MQVRIFAMLEWSNIRLGSIRGNETVSAMEQKEKDECVRLLHELGCSCVIGNGKKQWIGRERGVKDLLYLLRNEPAQLQAAFVADKVVGKAAASLMILGGISELDTNVLSLPAGWLLRQYGVPFRAGRLVPHIINRAGNDWCPLEKRCFYAESPEVCLQRIEAFLQLSGEKRKN